MSKIDKKYPVQTVEIQGHEFRLIGNTSLLNRVLTGFLCSRQCPAATILEAYETCKAWAGDSSRTIISGFHSPMEQECLNLLIQGHANIIHFPAREIESLRIRKEWRPALDNNRMLIIALALFKNRRMSQVQTRQRNEAIAELADSLYIPYATEGSQLSQLQ